MKTVSVRQAPACGQVLQIPRLSFLPPPKLGEQVEFVNQRNQLVALGEVLSTSPGQYQVQVIA
jgi:hypothetical protein